MIYITFATPTFRFEGPLPPAITVGTVLGFFWEEDARPPELKPHVAGNIVSDEYILTDRDCLLMMNVSRGDKDELE